VKRIEDKIKYYKTLLKSRKTLNICKPRPFLYKIWNLNIILKFIIVIDL